MTEKMHKNDYKYNSKANTVCILKLLESYSDGDIILPMAKIIELMESVYGLHVDRRTVYSSINILQSLGYQIESFEDNRIGYCLKNKPFDTLSIKLLIDSVRLNRVVPKKNEEEIIDKLTKFVPKEEKEHMMSRIVGSLKKEADMSLFYVLDTIDLAMQQQRKIEFDYPTKDGVLSHYILTPMTITQINYHYYLICSDPANKQNIIFRVKNVENISITEEPSGSYTYFKGFSILNQTAEGFDTINATLRCSCDIEEIFVDTFNQFFLNTKKPIRSEDNKTFTATVTGTVESLSRWALAYPDKCEVIEPLELREVVIEKIKNNKYGI